MPDPETLLHPSRIDLFSTQGGNFPPISVRIAQEERRDRPIGLEVSELSYPQLFSGLDKPAVRPSHSFLRLQVDVKRKLGEKVVQFFRMAYTT